MTLTCVIVILLTSLLALPFSYILNLIALGKDQKIILCMGGLGLLVVFLVPQYVIRIRMRPPKPKPNPFIHVLSILAFNSVMSLIAALENDGLIAEFLGSFLREGEPHLKSAHGTMMCYWDGIFHNAMYLSMMAAISWNQSFYDVGLYWAGSFGHRLLVLSLTSMIGKSPLRLVTILWCPFIFVCVWAAKNFLHEKAEEGRSIRNDHLKTADSLAKACKDSCISIWKRPVDLAFVAFYTFASLIAVFRFNATMGASSDFTKRYIQKVEPYLEDTLQFSKSEIMLQMFYHVPFYIMSIFAFLHPGHSWLPRWSLLHAGAAGQGQFAFMGSSFHYRTPYIYRVPQNWTARGLFWAINGLLFLVPQMVALRCCHNPDYFLLNNDLKVTENGSVVGGDYAEKNISVKKKE